jgi:hypothetical protein
MNPHRKFKNHSLGGLELIFMPLILCFITFTIFVLDPTHKNNRKKLQQNKPVAQQYTLNQSDPIWFYKPDEIGWTRGEVVYLWGYHPVIFSKDLNKTFKFHEVEWTTGYE